MSSTAENGLYFLFGGALLLLAAGWLHLLSKTHSLPFRSRCRTMLAMAVHGFVWILPSRFCVHVALAWLGGFIAGTLISGAISFGLVRCFVSTRPVVTEAHEGVGDALFAMMLVGCGAFFSGLVGVYTGFEFASRTYDRLAKTSP